MKYDLPATQCDDDDHMGTAKGAERWPTNGKGAMTERTLTQQVADLRDGDIVEARLGDATVKGPVTTSTSGSVVVAAGNQSIILSYSGSVDRCLTEIVSVERPKRRVKRGDVISFKTNLDSLEIPDRAAVRDWRGDVWQYDAEDGLWFRYGYRRHFRSLLPTFGPLRVIDVLG